MKNEGIIGGYPGGFMERTLARFPKGTPEECPQKKLIEDMQKGLFDDYHNY